MLRRLRGLRTAERLCLVLALMGAVLIGLGVAQDLAVWLGAAGWRRPFFNLNEERNAFAVFSTVNLMICAGLLAAIGARTIGSRRPRGLAWCALSAVFVYLAADEFFALHERLIPLGQAITLALAGTRVAYAWWAAVIPVLALAAIGFWPLVKSLPVRLRWAFAACGAAFLAGAVGMEIAQAAVCPVGSWVPEQSIWCRASISIEESLEAFSIVGFIYVLAVYLRTLPAWAQSQASTSTCRRISPSST